MLTSVRLINDNRETIIFNNLNDDLQFEKLPNMATLQITKLQTYSHFESEWLLKHRNNRNTKRCVERSKEILKNTLKIGNKQHSCCMTVQSINAIK